MVKKTVNFERNTANTRQIGKIIYYISLYHVILQRKKMFNGIILLLQLQKISIHLQCIVSLEIYYAQFGYQNKIYLVLCKLKLTLQEKIKRTYRVLRVLCYLFDISYGHR